MLVGEGFSRLFRTFEHTAFRLEARDRYNSPRETESFERFLAGEPGDLAWHQKWLAMLRESSTQGRRFCRARVVSLPLSNYSRFGLWISQFASEAGDDIRYLTRDKAKSLELPYHDYWLFDSRKLVRMHFGEDDRFFGGEVVEDPATIVRHNYWRDAAWHYAVRRDEFVSE
ncbi:MAG: hypothetical protein JO100_12105 [Pseudonocardia sp.]|nr:hypothetical protein [Pseudonocardia sp.]